MNAFERSWELTQASFRVMIADKELLLFPILSVLTSFALVIVLLFPTIILALFNEVSFAFSSCRRGDYYGPQPI